MIYQSSKKVNNGFTFHFKDVTILNGEKQEMKGRKEMKYEKLFTPIKIGNVEIKNRIAMAPMLMDFGQFDGRTTEMLMDYYEERAKGGTGLIFTEITRVNDRTGGAAFAQLGMSHDYQIEGMSELADRIHRHGAKLFVQLHHPGRQNMGLLIDTLPLSIACDKALPFFKDMLYKVVPAGKILMNKHLVPRVVSPSKCENSYFSDGNNRGLRKSEIKGLISNFVAAAVRVKKAGCDGVQLHASHGYLLQQFLCITHLAQHLIERFAAVAVSTTGSNDYNAIFPAYSLPGSHTFNALIDILIQRISAVAGNDHIDLRNTQFAILLEKSTSVGVRSFRIAGKSPDDIFLFIDHYIKDKSQFGLFGRKKHILMNGVIFQIASTGKSTVNKLCTMIS